MRILGAAIMLAQRGYAVHWLRARSKAPVADGWSTARVATVTDLRQTYRPGYNVGVRCGPWSQPRPDHGLVVLDVDIRLPEATAPALSAVETLCGAACTGPTVLSGSGNGSRHLWFACPVEALPSKANTTMVAAEGWKLEVLSTGKQVVVPPSIHPNGQPYRWLTPLLALPPLTAPLHAAIAAVVTARTPTPLTTGRVIQGPLPGPGTRPGDDFTRRADWPSILQPHGWRPVRTHGEVTHWRRSGKDEGISATTNYAGSGLLYVFSTNAAAFAQMAGRDYPEMADTLVQTVAKALVELAVAVEGVLRQMDTQHPGESHPSQATRLVTLALEAGVELFRTPEGDAYATIAVEQHKETWPLKVKGFRRWLARLFYQREAKTPGAQAVQDALGVLEGQALYDGPECLVSTRLAEHQGALYLDLTDDHWRAVEITPQGWRVMADPPVKFRRARGMLAVPVPVPGGSLAALRPLVNLSSEADWCLLVSWLVATLRPTGPYPILVIHGEHGSAKSTLVRMLRSLVDPNTAALRTTPRNEHDLVLAATNGWLVALDNLSHVPSWLSDACCRLATGSGFATRELYSDTEEALFAAQRPIVLNAIEELATRGDLLDRAVLLSLPTIDDSTRQDEKTFWSAFEQHRPALLGALLDVMSQGLQRLPSVQIDRFPRMADFALWACAVAPACGWTAQAFLEAYTGAREAAHDVTLEASPVAPYLRELVESRRQWEGTAGELLVALETLARGPGRLAPGHEDTGSAIVHHQAWPKNGRALSNALRRLAPTLRAVGIAITLGARTGKSRTRLITLAAPPSSAPGSTTGPACALEVSPSARVTGSV